MSLLAEIAARERAVWQALVDGDAEADRASLAEDFLGVYPDGFSGSDGHVAQLASGPTITDSTLSHVTVKPLGHSHALIAYAARFRRVGKGG